VTPSVEQAATSLRAAPDTYSKEYTQADEQTNSQSCWFHCRYLREGGDYTITSVCRFVCLSVCEQDYCKSNQLISLKLDVVIGPISRKNSLTFGGDSVPNNDTGSLFHSLRNSG